MDSFFCPLRPLVSHSLAFGSHSLSVSFNLAFHFALGAQAKLYFLSKDNTTVLGSRSGILSLCPIPSLCAPRSQHPTTSRRLVSSSLHKTRSARSPDPFIVATESDTAFDLRFRLSAKLAPRSHQTPGYLVFRQSSLHPLFCNPQTRHLQVIKHHTSQWPNSSAPRSSELPLRSPRGWPSRDEPFSFMRS